MKNKMFSSLSSQTRSQKVATSENTCIDKVYFNIKYTIFFYIDDRMRVADQHVLNTVK